MDLVQLKNDIIKNELSHFYIFSGPEIGLQNMYIHQIGKGKEVRTDSFSSIIKNISANNKIFSSYKDKVYVIRDDKDFMINEKLWQIEVKKGIVIFLVTHLDKRGKFYKHFKDIIIEFEKLSTNQLIPIVKNKLPNVSKQLISTFIEYCNNDYNTILNNIDKYNRLGTKEFNLSIIEDLCGERNNSTVFSLADALINKNNKKVFHELNYLLETGESEIGILSVLYKKIKDTILIEGYRNSPNIAKDTGINGWVCKNILENNRIKPTNLLTSIRLLEEYDTGIKQGKYTPDVALHSCIIKILSL